MALLGFFYLPTLPLRMGEDNPTVLPRLALSLCSFHHNWSAQFIRCIPINDNSHSLCVY